MTVKETLEHLLDRLPEEDQRRLLIFAEFLRWRQEQPTEAANGPDVADDDQAAAEAARFPLPNSKLRSLAAKHRPPQSWYEENLSSL